MDSLRSLGAKARYDEDAKAVEFSLSHDLSFSAASLRRTMEALEPCATDGDVTAEFWPKYGMVLTASLIGSDEDIKAGIELMLSEAVPLRVPAAKQDEQIDLLYVDANDLVAVMDSAQVLTVAQLKRFLRHLPLAEEHCDLRGSDLANMWRLTSQNGGYFVLETVHENRPVLQASSLADILRPKYGEHSVYLVDVLVGAHNDPAREMEIRAHVQGSYFDNDLYEMADRLRDNLPPGFKRISLPRQGLHLQMTYEGTAGNIAHPQLLGAKMVELLRPVFSTMGVCPTYGASIQLYYANPTDFEPTNLVQTSVTHYFPVVSDR